MNLDSRSCLLEIQYILGHKVSSTFARALRLQILYLAFIASL